MRRIYLDYNASAPLDPRVLQAFIRELEKEVGNPSSTHFDGRQCRHRLEQSRRQIATFFQVQPHEIVFTSGGTEGASLLLQGILLRHSTGHVLSSEGEHACVYQTLKAFEEKGFSVDFLPIEPLGAVCPEDVERAILPQTRLIALMAVNNETGVLTDIASIASIAKRANIPFVVDGVAWLGKEVMCLPDGVSALFFSGHKICAPKGVGFCICRPPLKLEPLFVGGGQEHNRRAGTENLPGIVALGQAIEILRQEQAWKIPHMRRLRDQLEQGLLSHLSGISINGPNPRISNTTNIAFSEVDGETLLMQLDMEGISASHGSACASGALEPSRVLLKMGIPRAQVQASLRFSVGPMTTSEEIDLAVSIIVRVVGRLRVFKE